MRRFFFRPGVLVTILVMLVFLVCMGLVWIFDLFLHVSLGWIFFLGRSFQETNFSPEAFTTAALCSLGFVVGLHFFIRRKARRLTSFDWNWKQTVLVASSTLLMFVAGISIVGVSHQISWMATSREPIVESNFEVVLRLPSRRNLRELSIALHDDHAVHETFPVGGSFDSEGRGLHSWETFLLPYIGQAKLHEKIDLTKPWTDDVQRKLFQKKIETFRNPGYDRRMGHTADNISHYAMNSHVAGVNRSRRLSELSDGTANTLFIGEVNHAPRAWGDPMNFRDPAIGLKKPNGFGSVWREGNYVQFAFADGSTRMISADIDPAVLKALSTPNGGELVRGDSF